MKTDTMLSVLFVIVLMMVVSADSVALYRNDGGLGVGVTVVGVIAIFLILDAKDQQEGDD